MRTQIVQIGNSQGIRIPKKLLEQSKLGNEVELELKDEGILIRSIKKTRENWEAAFQEMNANGDDELLDGDLPSQTTFDEEEWEW
jgi:antitoxin MazE